MRINLVLCRYAHWCHLRGISGVIAKRNIMIFVVLFNTMADILTRGVQECSYHTPLRSSKKFTPEYFLIDFTQHTMDFQNCLSFWHRVTFEKLKITPTLPTYRCSRISVQWSISQVDAKLKPFSLIFYSKQVLIWY